MAERRVTRLYLVLEIAFVLGIDAVLIQAVPLSRVLDGGWAGRLYSPARTVLTLVLIAWLLARTGQGWADIGVRRPASWRRTVLLGIGGFVVIFLIDQAVIAPLVRALGYGGGNLGRLASVEGNFAEYLYWAFPMSLFVAAVGEEFVGRAYLISRLEALTGAGRRWSTLVALLASSIVFGLAHAYQGPGGMIGTGAIGFLLGVLFLVAGRNIWAPVIAHALTDVFGFTMIYLGAVPAPG
jgi:membrane protease YdiL (CAAX protease family)